MPVHVALLRAVNVGGTGKLPIADLVKLCEKAGFVRVATYIQSGNVVFESPRSQAEVGAILEAALAKKLGKPTRVHVRSATELRAILDGNPFPKAPTNRVLVFFLDAVGGVVSNVKNQAKEELVLLGRELFVHYPEGQGTSKLVVPLAKEGTGRNLNTVAKLAEMAASAEQVGRR